MKLQTTRSAVLVRNIALVFCSVGMILLGVAGCTSETPGGPTDSDAEVNLLDQPDGLHQGTGEGTLKIGAMQYDLAIDQCGLKSTFLNGEGRLYTTIHGLTADEHSSSQCVLTRVARTNVGPL